MTIFPFIKSLPFLNGKSQLLSVAAEKLRQLLSVAVRAYEHKMHFPIFTYLAAFFTASRAREKQLTATGNGAITQ